MSSVTGIIKVYDGMRQERLIRTRYRIIEFTAKGTGRRFPDRIFSSFESTPLVKEKSHAGRSHLGRDPEILKLR